MVAEKSIVWLLKKTEWGDEMDDIKLTQEKKEQLIRRVTEVADSGALKMSDWMAIYDILLEACEREKAETMEQVLINSLSED